MDAIPFKTHETYAGFAETDGILGLEQNELIIQFQTKDGFLGALKSKVKEISIPIHQIQSITYKKGIFSPSLTFVVNDLKLMQELPGYGEGEVTLKFKKKYRDPLMDLRAQVERNITEHKLKLLKEDL